MIIIGAGMSGMLAGQHFRSLNPTILERQKELPNNHKALLRFRSESVSQLTGIPFKQVKVSKMINYKEAHISEPTPFLNNLYSMKVSGAIRGRSLSDISPCSRYIAPDDFIDKVSNGLDIKYGVDAHGKIINQIVDNEQPVISTMPVTTLAHILNYDLGVSLYTRPIWTVSFELGFLDCDVYQTVYYPNPTLPLYRLSITGNRVIAEFNEDPNELPSWEGDTIENLKHFLEIDFGITDFQALNTKAGHQEYGKLLPCSGHQVKDFMGWATMNYNIYSLGRWATHRQILMDDVVKDIHSIGRMINSNRYSR
jgi:hypothetical protein